MQRDFGARGAKLYSLYSLYSPTGLAAERAGKQQGASCRANLRRM